MSVLVTGGAGYIGSHAVLDLLDRGEDVVVIDDLSTGFERAIPEGVVFVRGDIGDADLIARLVRENSVDAVMHFAAKAVVPDSMAQPLTYYETNTVKTGVLVKTALEAGVGIFILSSTAAVYGDVGEAPVAEDTPLKPVSPYGRSKLAAEWIVEDVGRAHGLAYANLRYFNVAGADPAGRSGQSTAAATHLIKAAAQAALAKRGALEIYGTDYPTRDGTGVRDYIQVSDLTAAHIAALDHLRAGKPSLTLNIGYGRGYSVREVIDAVGQVVGQPIPVRESGRRAGDPASVVAEVARLRETLDWRPKYDDLETIAAQALAWERKL